MQPTRPHGSRLLIEGLPGHSNIEGARFEGARLQPCHNTANPDRASAPEGSLSPQHPLSGHAFIFESHLTEEVTA